jgi:hypothetical protein
MFDICDEHVKRVPYDKRLDDRYYNILKRCYDKKNKDYEHYGGRGIVMCDEWKENKQKFMRWCRDNGEEKGLEIDRIDNDKGYEPGNCRFVTKKVNRNNRRDSGQNRC